MSWFRRSALLLPLLGLFVFLTSCSDFWVSDSSIATVTVSPTALILKAATGGSTPVAGDSSSLTVTATTVGGDTADVTATKFTSSNTSVATVDATGKITVVGTAANANATITATLGGVSATCKVLTYTGTAPSTLTIQYPTGLSGSVIAGQQFKLSATASINGTTQDVSSYVTWASTQTAVASVDANGNVTVLTTAVAGDNFQVTATANLASGTVQGTSMTFSLPSI